MERYYHAGDKIEQTFLQVPTELLHSQKYRTLNNDARILYGILQNRLRLSIANNWMDASGRVFLYFKREDLAQELNVSLPTARKAVKQLIAAKLLQEETQGTGKPNKLYLLKVTETVTEINQNSDRKEIPPVIEPQLSALKKCLSENTVTENPFHCNRKEFSPPHDKEKNNYNNQDNNPLTPTTEKELLQEIREQIDYNTFLPSDRKLLDRVVYAIHDINTYNGCRYRISRRYYSINDVKQAFNAVNKPTVVYVLNAIKSAGKIINLNGYIKTVIMNAYLNGEIFTKGNGRGESDIPEAVGYSGWNGNGIPTMSLSAVTGNYNKKKPSFCDIEQRNYDYDALMDAIRGW